MGYRRYWRSRHAANVMTPSQALGTAPHATPATKTVHQIMMQSFLANGLVPAKHVNAMENIAVKWTGRLTPAQERYLLGIIQQITGLAQTASTPVAQPAPVPVNPTLANVDKIFDLFRGAMAHLKRPHIYIPMDLSKPITQSCDVLKLQYSPAYAGIPGPYGRSARPERIEIRAKINRQNSWVATLETSGLLIVTHSNWYIRKGMLTQQTLENTLTEFLKDPVGNTAKWGKLLSRCCYCWLPLSTPESLSVGYGPDCAAHHNLPWGKKQTKTNAKAILNAIKNGNFTVSKVKP